METIHEIEFKALLTKDIYNKIKTDYMNYSHQHYQQTNYYLSHPVLEKLLFMLRIRAFDDHYELTLKQRLDIGNKESNLQIDATTMNKILNQQPVENEIFDILKQYQINSIDLESKMSLTTYRYDFKLPEGTLSLDKNEYNGITDYEIEYEVTNYQDGMQRFLGIASEYSIDYQNNCPSKIKRVIDSYKQV